MPAEAPRARRPRGDHRRRADPDRPYPERFPWLSGDRDDATTGISSRHVGGGGPRRCWRHCGLHLDRGRGDGRRSLDLDRRHGLHPRRQRLRRRDGDRVHQLLRPDLGPGRHQGTHQAGDPATTSTHREARPATSPTSGRPPAIPTKGYYAYDLGAWRIVRPEQQLRRRSAAATPARRRSSGCAPTSRPIHALLVAMWHHPRFSSGEHGNDPPPGALAGALRRRRRRSSSTATTTTTSASRRRRPTGGADAARGIREFVVGTGGRSHYPFSDDPRQQPGPQRHTYGVLRAGPLGRHLVVPVHPRRRAGPSRTAAPASATRAARAGCRVGQVVGEPSRSRLQPIERGHLVVHRRLDGAAHDQALPARQLGIERERQPASRPHQPRM